MTAEAQPAVRDRTWIVAGGAALWGTDALLRLPLATELPATTVVLAEHVIVAVLISPMIVRAIRRAARVCGPRQWAALIGIGVGASAVATALFTAAFVQSGPITPVVLQKLQPLVAVALAAVLLGERLRRTYLPFLVVALGASWLLAFPDPFGVSVQGVVGALMAIGAAALWAAGTVLGRYVSPVLRPGEVTGLRYAFGLLGSAAAVAVTGAPVLPPVADLPGLAGLALIPGLLAMLIYYHGLRGTPASRATLAELAFPATAAVVGVVVLGETMTATQWAGLALLAVTVTLFSWHERRPAARAAVRVPEMAA
ncbi:MAG: EamA family transporter [Streptosporangiales bacterium]|nr:EamA family transporter [Streptosporangiales bacterium]